MFRTMFTTEKQMPYRYFIGKNTTNEFEPKIGMKKCTKF